MIIRGQIHISDQESKYWFDNDDRHIKICVIVDYECVLIVNNVILPNISDVASLNSLNRIHIRELARYFFRFSVEDDIDIQM